MIAIGATSSLGYLDFVTGDELSHSIFYLLPITYATWFIRPRAGLLIAILCAASWVAVEMKFGERLSNPLAPIWNGTVRLMFFCVGVSAVASVRKTESRLLREILQRTRELREESEHRRRIEREMFEFSSREQVRMAQDLHDGLGQYLSALSFHARILADDLRQQASPQLPQAERLVSIIRVTNQTTRQLDRALRVPASATQDFIGAIRSLVGDQERLTGVRFNLEAPERVIKLDDFSTMMLYRIVQEALNNAVKHANPRVIWLSFVVADGKLNVAIRDDGHGTVLNLERESGTGVRAMKLRAQLIGAQLDFGTADSGGCTVSCSLPLIDREVGPEIA